MTRLPEWLHSELDKLGVRTPSTGHVPVTPPAHTTPDKFRPYEGDH